MHLTVLNYESQNHFSYSARLTRSPRTTKVRYKSNEVPSRSQSKGKSVFVLRRPHELDLTSSPLGGYVGTEYEYDQSAELSATLAGWLTERKQMGGGTK